MKCHQATHQIVRKIFKRLIKEKVLQGFIHFIGWRTTSKHQNIQAHNLNKTMKIACDVNDEKMRKKLSEIV